MKFEDEEIGKLELTKVSDLARLIIEYLCGQKYYKPLSEEDEKLLTNLVGHGKLNYEQFNELLLLLNQDRVEEAFYKFLFEKDRISWHDIKKGVIKFRGFAMLCFGNFRFAYKLLITKGSEDELRESLEPYWRNSSEIIKEFKRRPPKMLEIEKIEREKVWYAGEITGAKISNDANLLTMKEADEKDPATKKELLEFGKQILQMDADSKETQEKALKNTDVYLTWDYMDVYIATSMRHKWEFEETFNFIGKVFSKRYLRQLNLRHFDPTQSKCSNPRDKGLIEGLMLKRALCTIYMAQESDTMGKDSELAATLAQSTPVIAYVPKYESDADIDAYSKKIEKYPLDFFKKRLLILRAEEVFDDPECGEKLRAYDPNFTIEKVDAFLKKLDDYRALQPFSLWFEKDDREFKRNDLFSNICRVLAIAESYNFERRAQLLKERHPLSMQVDLQSGVANGVLVVRNHKECSELLYRILTNSMEFIISHEGKPEKGYTILKEKISMSPFRVVTDYERLTNSFWNLFA